MAPKSNVWDNSALLLELTFALYEVANKNGALTPNSRAAVQTYLQAAGFTITWDAIR